MSIPMHAICANKPGSVMKISKNNDIQENKSRFIFIENEYFGPSTSDEVRQKRKPTSSGSLTQNDSPSEQEEICKTKYGNQAENDYCASWTNGQQHDENIPILLGGSLTPNHSSSEYEAFSLTEYQI